MTIQTMKEIRKELGISNQELARRTGLPVSTIQRLFSGKTEAPRMHTLRALEKALRAISSVSAEPKEEKGAQLSETALRYEVKKQGEYTVEDYYALPDERRVELIDGVIYDMAAPSAVHQRILGELHLQFRECIDAHNGNCEVFLSPCDVQLDRDNRTILQPDLFVICREVGVDAKAIDGAPDLTVEILSESTRSKDMLLKTYKYLNAGVREYWIIDPKNRRVMVYFFEKTGTDPEKYSFEDEIPIHISGGACRIDFGKIYKGIAAYYD